MEAALSAGRLSVSCPCQFSKSSYLNVMTNASLGGDWLRDLTTRSGWRPKKKAACLFGGVSWGEHMNAYGSEGDKKWRVFFPTGLLVVVSFRAKAHRRSGLGTKSGVSFRWVRGCGASSSPLSKLFAHHLRVPLWKV